MQKEWNEMKRKDERKSKGDQVVLFSRLEETWPGLIMIRDIVVPEQNLAVCLRILAYHHLSSNKYNNNSTTTVTTTNNQLLY